MAICRYFQQGTCRYGDRCKFEHVVPNQQQRQPQSAVGFSFTRSLQQVQSNNPQTTSFASTKHVTFDRSQDRVHYFSRAQPAPAPASGFSFTKALQSAQPNNMQNMSASFFPQQQQQYRQQHHQQHQQYQQIQYQQHLQQPQVVQGQYQGRAESMGLYKQASDASFFTHGTSGFSFGNNVDRSVGGGGGGGGGGRGQEVALGGLVHGGGVERGKSMEEGESVTAASKSSCENSVYCELSSLSQQEVECFQADSFCFARIPVKSPPMQFCT